MLYTRRNVLGHHPLSARGIPRDGNTNIVLPSCAFFAIFLDGYVRVYELLFPKFCSLVRGWGVKFLLLWEDYV